MDCSCARTSVPMCTEMCARVGDVYWAAWVEDALCTVGFHICIYMLACRQVSGSFSCIELSQYVPCCVHERVATPRACHVIGCHSSSSPSLGSLGEGRQTRVPAVPYTRVHVRPRGSVLRNMND